MPATVSIEPIIDQVAKTFPDYNSDVLRHAYEVAAHAHRDQKRKTGEPYVNHCIATAAKLAELRMDPPVVVAGLLHDTVEDTELTLEEVRQEFGEEVARLVDGVTKLSQIAGVTGHRKRDLDQQEAESLRKMFLAMGEDVRIVLIKLADRLHNMQTLHGLSREKQIRMARETLDIFAPLANRLGIWKIKWELEDLCLRYLEPEVFCSLVERLNERHEEREAYVEEVITSLQRALEETGIKGDVSGRSKHIYSIYKKMKHKERDLDQIFDVRAVRVIVANKAECYATLGIVHSLWRPIPQEFDDYIANPKQNNYQSLHTAVYGPGGKALEVQIRDREMHRLSEYGVAAHWRYKEQLGRDSFLEDKIRLFRRMLDWHDEDRDGTEDEDAVEFVNRFKSEMQPEQVFVFTPKGEIRELPAGATPLDFAYYIHTDIGHRCRGAKVNGNIVPLSYQLKDGDQIEILTTKRGSPSRDWLSPYLGYVKTTRAKSKIRVWFRHQDRDENIRQGRDMMERELRKLGLRESLEKLAHQNKFDKLDDFLVAIGAGDLSPHGIAIKLLDNHHAQESFQGIEAEAAAFHGKGKAPSVTTERLEQLDASGVRGLMTKVAGCCNPVPGDDIIGYVTRGQGITVHRRDCTNILSRGDKERMIELDWGGTERTNVFPVSLRILALDREGLLRDIVDVVSNEGVNMRSVNAVSNKSDNSAVITAVLEVHDASQLLRILSRINKLPNVYEAHRATG
ncbi:MAG: bifunctional (p)ppGpp synthetase/guanosine-3',5'-bis(diphosphate) 3'-pyrophosphohydrolase [Ardenticatenales bacterium]|nr:bifunctional (p)ppGpp synthetase/guanosine-3',5'-bis(diphosphate) 3'-pyrophosphohydrolase [Ardenticatenales bacterium]